MNRQVTGINHYEMSVLKESMINSNLEHVDPRGEVVSRSGNADYSILSFLLLIPAGLGAYMVLTGHYYNKFPCLTLARTVHS